MLLLLTADSTFEHPKHVFKLMNKKIIFILYLLSSEINCISKTNKSDINRSISITSLYFHCSVFGLPLTFPFT